MNQMSRISIAFCFLLLFLSGGVAQAHERILDISTTEHQVYVSLRERILDYDVTITVQPDSSIDVIEKIRVRVSGHKIKLGIFRNLPVRYFLRHQNIKTPFTVHSVTLDGQPENYWLENNGAYQKILIGPEKDLGHNHLSRGDHTYVIHWSGVNHLRSFENYDELYFNATGNDWEFPIDNVTVRVVLPDSVNIMQFAGYVGKPGSTESASGWQEDGSVIFSSRPLKVGEAITVAVGFSKGILKTPWGLTALFNKILDYTYPYLNIKSLSLLCTTLLVFIFYLVAWSKLGKDEPLGVITPLYELSSKISPAMAEVLWNGRFYSYKRALSASIINLASKGFVTVGDKKIIRVTTSKKPVAPEEAALLKQMFSNRKTLNLETYTAVFNNACSDYRNKLKTFFTSHIQQNRKIILLGIALHLGLLLLMPDGFDNIVMIGIQTLITFFYIIFVRILLRGIRGNFLGGAISLLFVLAHGSVFLFLMLSSWLDSGGSMGSPGYIIALGIYIATVLMHIVFYVLMDKPLPATVTILQELAGLRMFIEAVDKNRYKLITPSVFEKNLPYAIIFGLEKKWLEEFRSLYPDYEPGWREQGLGSFSHHDIGRLSGGLSTASTAPSSSSGGSRFGSSSGSGGGGSVGGGSGGGGGGGR